MSYNVGKNFVFLEDVLPYYMLLKISYPLMDCFEFRACLAGSRCLCSQNLNEYSNKPAKGIILRRSGYFKYIPPNKFVPFHKCWAQFSHYDRWGRQIPCRVIFLPRPLLFVVNRLRFRIRQHFRLPRTLDCSLGDSTGPH